VHNNLNEIENWLRNCDGTAADRIRLVGVARESSCYYIELLAGVGIDERYPAIERPRSLFEHALEQLAMLLATRSARQSV